MTLSGIKQKLRHRLILPGVVIFFVASFVISNSKEVVVFDREGAAATLLSAPEPLAKPIPAHIATPPAVRAVYISSWVAGVPSIREKLLDFVTDSEINSVVIDIKDYTGKISFPVSDPVIAEMGSQEPRIGDIQALMRYLHEKNIYVIGRISVFQDPYIARSIPKLAVGNSRGGVWRDRKGLSYIDPGAEIYWDYIVRIARESENLGFDEINFDYVRYPSDGAISLAVFPFSKGREKQIVIEDFFRYLHTHLEAIRVPLSVDLFGLTTWAENDLGVGQVLERAAPYFDFVAPMTYPSHYDPGFEGYKNPADHPYEILFSAVTRAKERLEKMGQDPNKLRPWIQDFDLGADYGITQVNAQKRGIYDAGLQSWMAWDPSNQYTKEAYRP